jgi:hypothetical protein
MIAWIVKQTGLSALAVKLILLAAGSGVIWYGLRLWGNAQWAKGEAQGRITATANIQKAKDSEWKAKESAITADAKAVADEKLAVRAAGERLNQDRANLSRTLKDGLAAIQQERNRNYANTVAIVPDTALWDAIRTVSGDLAAPHP